MPSASAVADAAATRWTPLRASPWLRPVLLVCFVGGGFAALVYEIVWFQLLEYVLGASAISVGILLAAYMGGLCLGSQLSPRLARWLQAGRVSPMRAYALMEIGTGIFGLAILWGLPLVSRLYGGLGANGAWDLALRAVIAGACLMPPTVLMGATLPTVAAWVESTPHGIARIGGLYAANTAGAIAGCLAAGFYLLRIHDMAFATGVAVGINLLLGVVALAIASRLPAPAHPAPRLVPSAPAARPAAAVLLAIALSGACALGAEVVWTRLMALLLGQTVYTFSIILGVLLSGLALGGWLGTLRAQATSDAARDLGIAQALLTGGITWAAWMLARSLPYWPVVPALGVSPWIDFQLDLVRCAWVALPAAVLWGASFPLALAAATTPGADPRRVVAAVYAANTMGAIAGALLTTFWLVPAFGTAGAQRALIAAAGVAGAVALARAQRGGAVRFALAAVALVAAVGFAPTVPQVPATLIANGRSLAVRLGTRDGATNAPVPLPSVLYVGEGMNESVAVSETGRVRLFHVSGKTEASTAPHDMRLQRMLGELPALLHPGPRSVLIVGFGAGVTAGSFLEFPSVQRVVICEIEPLIPQRVAPFFVAENHGVANDPRVTIVYDDARHYMLTTREKFDVITSDPIHPWVKGSAALYSKEYFDLVRRHLNPGGAVSQWLPLYQSSEATIRGEVATFFAAFPGGTLWANNVQGKGYDMVMLGSDRTQSFDLPALNTRLRRPDHAAVVGSLQSLGYASPAEFLATYAGRQRDLQPWLAGAEINHDHRLWLQYQAGLETFREDEASIASHLSSYRAFPEDLFAGPDELKDAIRAALPAAAGVTNGE